MRFLRMLWQCFVVWRAEPARAEELRQAKAILVFATSRLRDGTAGPCNLFLARVAQELHGRYHLSIVAQQEVAMAAPELPVTAVARGGNRLGASSSQWNTAAIVKFAIGVHHLEPGDRLVMVAPPPHLPRCLWIAERLGLNALAAPMPGGSRYFHRESALWYCRGGGLRFRLREFFARLYCLFRGDI